jgi:hypothetical protein
MSSADNMKSFKTHLNEAMDRPPKWKKDTSDGEGGAQIIEFPKTKAKYRVSKFLDDGDRHKGEWNLEAWDPRRREFVWADTLSPKAWVKELIIYRGQFKHDRNGEPDKKQQVADYSKTFKFRGHH